MTTTINLQRLTEAVVENDLAPPGAVTAELTRDNRVMLTVELPATNPRRVHWLNNWLDVLMDPIDMIADKTNPADDLLRLKIRGFLHRFLDYDGMAIISAPFSETAEPHRTAAILDATIDHAPGPEPLYQDPTELVEQLLDLMSHEEA